MLTDREQETWREIQRQLVDDPTFHPVERPGPGDHHRPTRLAVVVVTLTLVVLLLVGPNLLTEAEITDRQRPPRPDKSSAPPGLDPGAYTIGTEWALARESRGLAGSTDVPLAGRLGVSAPGSAPSAAA